MRIIKRLSRPARILPLFTLFASCFSAGALAGGPGSVIYAPVASSVPTLGGTALIVLALLMAVVAFRVMRKAHSAPLKLMVGLIATAAISSGIGGAGLISEAVATGNPVSLENPSGGQENLVCDVNLVTNTTDVPMNVEVKTNSISVTVAKDTCSGSPLPGSGSSGNECTVDLDCGE